eukprot:Pgem_evm1s9286
MGTEMQKCPNEYNKPKDNGLDAGIITCRNMYGFRQTIEKLGESRPSSNLPEHLFRFQEIQSLPNNAFTLAAFPVPFYEQYLLMD